MKWLAAILLFLAIAGCKSTPEGVLEEEKMVAVFTDIHIAEGRLKVVSIFTDSAKKMAPVLYDQVYRNHQITPEQFQKSYDYYTSDPKKLDAILDKVIVELSKRESGIK